MKRGSLLPTLLILGGLVLASYPVGLTLKSRLEQNQLIEDFRNVEQAGSTPISSTSRSTILAPAEAVWPPTILEIPKISLEVPVVEVKDLSIFEQKVTQGPGHYANTALPGQIGNVAIAGHVNGPAGYFKDLDKLNKGDKITLKTPQAEYQYVVEGIFTVNKDDWSVISPTDYAALTLTTCKPVGLVTSAKRLIVRAKLKDLA